MGRCRSYLPSDGSLSMPSILESASAPDLTGLELDVERRQDERAGSCFPSLASSLQHAQQPQESKRSPERPG